MIQTYSRIYEVYGADQIDNLDMSLYQEAVRWNNNSTQFILEFLNTPESMDQKLSQSDALDLMNTDSWKEEDII